MGTPLKTLQGVSYWVIEDPESIYEYVNRNIRQEWELDARESGETVEQNPWLRTLPQRRWTLEVARLDEIRMNPRIMDYKDETRGYNFQQELAKRRVQLRRSLDYGSVIWPVTVDEKMILRDGYCRYSTLAAMGITQTFCYLGTIRSS